MIAEAADDTDTTDFVDDCFFILRMELIFYSVVSLQYLKKGLPHGSPWYI